MSRSRYKNRAKPVWIQLAYPFRTYSTLKSALKNNPHTSKEDWHKFDSTGEYNRYMYLVACETEGDISDLQPHPDTIEISPRLTLPKNTIRPNDRFKQRRVYTPDFRYVCNGIIVWEDYKGYKANAYDNLRHALFIRHLIDTGHDPTTFHFKVVTNECEDPSEE